MIASSQLHNQLSIQNLSIFKKNLTTYRFPTFGSIIFRSFILVTYVFLIVFRLLLRVKGLPPPVLSSQYLTNLLGHNNLSGQNKLYLSSSVPFSAIQYFWLVVVVLCHFSVRRLATLWFVAGEGERNIFSLQESRIERVVFYIISPALIDFVNSPFGEVCLVWFIVIVSLPCNWICYLIFANVSIHCSFWSLVIINYDIFSFFNFFYVKVVEDNPSYWDVISSALAVGWQEIVVSGYRIFT